MSDNNINTNINIKDTTPPFYMFVRSVYNSLLDERFFPIGEKFTEERIIRDKFFAAIKNEGGVMYITAFYDIEGKIDIDISNGFLDKKNRFTESVSAFAKEHNARNVIVFHIYTFADNNINESAFDELTSFIDSNAEEYIGQPIYEVYYGVSLATEKIYVNKKQPSNIMKMDSIIADAIENFDKLDDYSNVGLSLYVKAPNEILVYVLLVINTFVFAMMELNGGSENAETLLWFGALYGFDMTEYREYYRFFTAMFVHIGIMHLLFNSVSLYIFGQRIEKYYGRVKFLIIYFISGLTGNLSAYLFSSYSIAAGASGAIFGLLGASLAITQVRKRSIDGLNSYMMILFVISGVLFGYIVPNISNSAHLGGLIGGYLIGLIMCLIDTKKLSAESGYK